MKRHLLFAMLCIVGALNLSAQIKEVDMTSKFSSLTAWNNWVGATGYTATNFCPMVEVNGLGQRQVCEKYQEPCTTASEIFSTTVTGLTAGTYKIELYGGAAYTFGRGFTSPAFSEGTWNAGDKIDPPGTGVTLYAESEGNTYGGEIPIYYATNFPDGAAVITLDGIVVGASGSIKIGMSQTANSTNWHVIQLKSVIAQVDMADLIADKKADLQALVDEAAAYPSDAELAAAVTEAQGYIATTPADVTEADALIANLEASIAKLPKLITAAKNAASVAGASATNPIKTNFVINGTFDTAGNVAPWQTTGSFQNVTTATNQNGAFTVPFFENWNPSAKANKMYQVIENIPNGTYELDICAFVQTYAGDGQTSQYVFANEAKTYITTGTPTAYKVFVQVTDNKIEVGFEQTEAISQWMGIDNVSLKYYGDCTVEEAQFGSYIASVAELKAQIAAMTNLPPAMNTIKDNNLASKPDTYTSVEEYEAAITELTGVLAEVKEAEAAYARYNTLRGYVTSLLAVPNNEIVANSHAVLEAANTEGTMESIKDINAAYDALKAAAMQYVADANPADGAQFDITFLLTNPDVTSFWTGAWEVRPEGWYTDQLDDAGNVIGNFQVMANEDMGPGGQVFMEYWQDNGRTDGFVLYQKITLPEGTYQMSGKVGLLQNAGGTTANMTFSANDTDGSQVAVGPLAAQSVEFVNSEEQEVKIGIKAHEGNSYRWIGINDIHLYKVAPKKFVINEAENYDYSQDGAGDVELYRDFHWNDYNTLVLPFNMTEEEVHKVFGPATRVYYAESFANNIISLRKSKEGSVIKANTPCVILLDNQLNIPVEIPARTLVPATDANPLFVRTDITTVGNYNASYQIVPNDMTNWIIGYGGISDGAPTDGATLYYVNSEVHLSATKAYFSVSGATEAKAITMTVDGEATGIATVENGEVNFHAGKIFDLSGREVKNPARGIYIVGGKKVMIK